MALASSFSPEDAIASIKEKGFYGINDASLGKQVVEFRERRLPTKTAYGLDFVARNALNERIRAVAKPFLDRPRWGLLKMYSDELPADLVYFFNNRTTTEMPALIIQLWPPNSRVLFYTGAHLLFLDAQETEWGLLGLPSQKMNMDGIIKDEFETKEGGLTIMDSRLGFTIVGRYSMNIGYVTHEEIEEWAKMELPDSQVLRTKVDEIQSQGIGTNFTFVSTSGAEQEGEQKNTA